MIKQFPTFPNHSAGHVPVWRADLLSKGASTTLVVFFRNTFLFKFVQKENIQEGKRIKILLLDTTHNNWQHLLCKMDFILITIMEIMVYNTHLKNHIHLDLI